MEFVLGAAEKLQRRGRRRVGGAGLEQQGSCRGEGGGRCCRGEGVLWCVQCAQWTVMLTLMLGEDLDVRTWV